MRRLERVPGWALFLGVLASYVGFAQYVIWLNDPVRHGAGFWPANGVTLAALLLLPRRRWGWILAAVVVGEIGGDTLLQGYPLIPSGWWATGNVVEPLVAALLLRRGAPLSARAPLRNVLRFLLLGVIVAPLLGAVFGAIGTVAEYGRDPFDTWVKFWVGDGIGLLVVSPLLLTFIGVERRGRGLRELAALLALVAVVVGAQFLPSSRELHVVMPYLMTPLLIWAALRYGLRGAAGVGFILAHGANVASAVGLGAASLHIGDGHAVTILQLFIGISLSTALIVAALVDDLADKKEVEALLSHQAGHDYLTSLPNRMLLMRHLQEALADGTSVGLLFIDLDGFKGVNDSLGHGAGDELLQAVADRLLTVMRTEDTISRLGGDEFAILLRDVGSSAEALGVAARVHDALAAPVELAGRSTTVSASVGVAVGAPGEELARRDLLHDADLAMYRAKTSGRGQTVRFEPYMRTELRTRVELQEDLAEALAERRLHLEYQPVVEIATGRLVGIEALCRWQHPTRGPVAPDEFLPLAEDAGLLAGLGVWVLSEACSQMAAWRLAEPRFDDVNLAVNLSGHDLGDPYLVERVLRTVVAHGILPQTVVLEVTETAVLTRDFRMVADRLAALRAAGVSVALDDFGTGYSSLSYLNELPVNILKMDRSFIERIGEPGRRTLTANIVRLGNDLGLDVVAEGIETAEQLTLVAEIGCRYGQGFLMARPLDPDAMVEFERTASGIGADQRS